jgi:hypothetical protein
MGTRVEEPIVQNDNLDAVVAVHVASGRWEIEPGSFRRGTGVAFLDEPQPSFFWRTAAGATVHARASDIVAIETAGDSLVELPPKAIIHNDLIPGNYDDTPNFIDGLTRPNGYAEH